jgi:hypothetical protein
MPTWPAWSRSKHPPVATTVPPDARTEATSASTSRPRVGPDGGGRRALAPVAEVDDDEEAAAPPAATNADARATASSTASGIRAPVARARAAAPAKRSPAPHGSPPVTTGAGTTSGGPS